MKPAIRKLENGDVVVDLGLKWYRVSVVDGSVIAVEVVDAHPQRRPATAKEAAYARRHVALATRPCSGH